MSYKIYCCTDKENGYKYIGVTKNSIQARLAGHCSEVKYGTSTSPFKKALKSGRRFIVHTLHDNIETAEEAAKLEKYYIDKYRTYVGFEDCKGYNGTRGGEVVPSHLISGSKCVLQYDVNCNFIKYFDSISQAADEVGVSRPALTAVLNGNGITCAGYQWRYANDNRPVVPVKNGMDNVRRAVSQYDLDGNLIATYKSVEDAAKKLNTYSSSIVKVCKGQHHSHRGYIWRYCECDGRVTKVSGLEEVSKSSTDRKRAVLKFTLDGKFLERYDSVKEAKDSTGISVSAIRRACQDFKFTSGGYRWKFEDNKTCVSVADKMYKRPVRQYDIHGHILNKFESILEASKQTGVERTSIYRCCTGKTNTGGGFMWEYEQL